MPLTGEYEPSTTPWVRDQVELYESSGGTKGTTMRDLPVIVLTSVGARSGKIRKTPLMRVEHDGPVRQDMVAREVTGAEREQWWERSVAAFPDYADYQVKTGRVIPVFVLSRRGSTRCDVSGGRTGRDLRTGLACGHRRS